MICFKMCTRLWTQTLSIYINSYKWQSITWTQWKKWATMMMSNNGTYIINLYRQLVACVGKHQWQFVLVENQCIDHKVEDFMIKSTHKHDLRLMTIEILTKHHERCICVLLISNDFLLNFINNIVYLRIALDFIKKSNH